MYKQFPALKLIEVVEELFKCFGIIYNVSTYLYYGQCFFVVHDRIWVYFNPINISFKTVCADTTLLAASSITID